MGGWVGRLTQASYALDSARARSLTVYNLGVRGDAAVTLVNRWRGDADRRRRKGEDMDVVAPAVEEARAQGIDVEGPIPADTLFHFAARGRYPAVVAMYHDQGLAPLKLLHFGEAVNVTLGLPIVRTSPDHGTGYDLVGTGTAKLTSFSAALDLARRLAG